MYLKTTGTYGNRVEVRKYHTVRYGKPGEPRSRRKKPTTEAMKKANARRREDNLRRLMVANFTEDDLHLTLTYRRELRPDEDTAKKHLKKFWVDLRRVYRKAGAELKYIAVTEQLTRAIHHHIVMNDPGIPNIAKLIRKLWKHGGYHVDALYPDRDYSKLASYFMKPEAGGEGQEEETPEEGRKKKYTCSRNLTQPVRKTEVIRANSWREKEPTVPKRLRDLGYVMECCTPKGKIDSFGYAYQSYIMV